MDLLYTKKKNKQQFHLGEGGVMKNEITKAETRMLSSTQYVSVVMKKPDTVEDHVIGRVKVLTPRYCQHTATMCIECTQTWGIDYTIFYDRTIAGRRLKEQLDAIAS